LIALRAETESDQTRSFALIGHLIEGGKEQVLLPLVMMLGQALED
jgi:hypothetical protein